MIASLTALLLTGTGCLQASAPEEPAEPRATVILPSGRTLSVEVADTPEKRARGYMFRRSVPEGEGMVFLMDQDGFHPFWMRDCLIALDIIWLDEKWRIVHIERSVPPCEEDPCPSYVPMQRSRYVLEVGSGGAYRLGLGPGDRVAFVPAGQADKEP